MPHEQKFLICVNSQFDDTLTANQQLRRLHDQADAELRQASSLLSEVVEWRSHSSPPPDRTPTPPLSDHANREGDSSGSGREASQEASGGGTDQSSPDQSEIQDDGGGQHSPGRSPIREDVEERHTPEPSESGHDDRGSSASNQSSEGEVETDWSANSTEDEILAARSRSRSEACRGSVPLGCAKQPIDLSGSASPSRQNPQVQPPPSPGLQHSAGQSPPRTPDRQPPTSPSSSPDSPPARPILAPPLFPIGNSLPGGGRSTTFVRLPRLRWIAGRPGC
ncbi:unnamed protein product [Phytophthora fragariaefolia]|uniref:Unnamed protein product n=1 Tax=Phytophthora fragariaefolia TaxID=1490495 RepID=A0A9W6WSN2_9STRA|nr:unnamed protein product [Phytophthora fragariaefolia]